jgi:hypothetical protein
MTGALIMNRDGIAGTWQGALYGGAQLPTQTLAHLERWEPWVRGAVFDFELLSHLQFSRHTEGGKESFTLWHVEVDDAVAPPTADTARIATMIRPTEAIFRSQLDLVETYADLREDRAGEVLAQLGPPTAFWSSIVHLHPDHKRWTLELIDAALRFANLVEMRFKHALACRRPVEYSAQIQPIILTPGHATLPSGHATEAFMIAYLLRQLVPGIDFTWSQQLMRQAARVAINRTVAGVHFPVDSAAGQVLGLTLGEYFVHRCRAADSYTFYYPWRFDGERYPPGADFDWRLLYDAPADTRLSDVYTDVITAEVTTAQPSDLLNWLWNKAAAEWT